MKKIFVYEFLKVLPLRNVAKMAGVSSRWLKLMVSNESDKIKRHRLLLELLMKHAYGEKFSLDAWFKEQLTQSFP